MTGWWRNFSGPSPRVLPAGVSGGGPMPPADTITIDRGYQAGVDYGTAGDIFVATDGSDTTGDGSVGNPYATPGKAVAEQTTGDVIKLRGGTYRGGGYSALVSGVDADNRARMEPYGTEEVILSGAVVIPLTFTACADASEAGGNANFASIYYADVPASLSPLDILAWNPNQGGTGRLYFALHSASTSNADDFEDYFFANDAFRGYSGATIHLPRPVTFDGADDYLTRGAGLTGAADGDQLSIGLRFATASDGAARTLWASDNGRMSIGLDASDQVVLTVLDTTGTTVVNHTCTGGTVKTADGLVTLLVSLNSTSGAIHVYLDGVDITGSAPSVTTGGDIDWTDADWSVAAETDGSAKFDGDIEFLWVDDVALDFSSSSIRADFDEHVIGEDGDEPTGSPPLVFLTANVSSVASPAQQAARWNAGTNAGTGGDFTMAFGGAVASTRAHPSYLIDTVNAVGWSTDEVNALVGFAFCQPIWSSNRIQPLRVLAIDTTTGRVTFSSPQTNTFGSGGYWSLINALPALDKAGLCAVDPVADGSGNHRMWVWPEDDETLDNFEISAEAFFLDCNGQDYWRVQGLKARHYANDDDFGDSFFVGSPTGTGSGGQNDYWDIFNNRMDWFGGGAEGVNWVGSGPVQGRFSDRWHVKQNTIANGERCFGIHWNTADECIENRNDFIRPGSTARRYALLTNSILLRNKVTKVSGGHAGIFASYQNSNNLIFVGERAPSQNGQVRIQESHDITFLASLFGVSDVGWAIINETQTTAAAYPEPFRIINCALTKHPDHLLQALLWGGSTNLAAYFYNSVIYGDGSDYSNSAIAARLIEHENNAYTARGPDQIAAYWTQGTDEVFVSEADCFVDPANGDYDAKPGGPLDGTGQDVSAIIDALKTQFSWAGTDITDEFDYDEAGRDMVTVPGIGARASTASAPSTEVTFTGATAAEDGHDGATGNTSYTGNAKTIFSVWTTSATTPDHDQIMAGTDENDDPAQHDASFEPGTTPGTKTVPTIDGVLLGETTYYRHDTAISQNGRPSTNQVTTAAFTTDEAPLWTPADATSATLELWLDPTTGVTLDGSSNVEKIADRTGNWTFVQTNASYRPPMTTLGGVAAIDFSGSDDLFLELADTATETTPQYNIGATNLFADAGDAFTVFSCLKQILETNAAFGRTTTSIFCIQLLTSGGLLYPRCYTRGTLHGGNKPFTDGTVGGVAMYRWSGSVFHQTADGDPSHAVQTPGTGSYAETGESWILGNWDDGRGTTAGKQIQADYIVFSGSLSDAEARMVEGYVMWKYGLQANLKTGHPYESAPPTTS